MSNAKNAREAAAAAAAAAEKKRRVKVALTYTGLVAAVLVVVIVIAFVAKSSGDHGPAAEGNFAADLTTLTTIPQSTYDAVGAGKATKLSAVTGGTALTEAGKPVVIYVGGDFCPFCAGQRWALIAALSRFGTWDGITRQSSSSSDVYPSTSTFSFHGATYTSKYVVFSGTEVEDVNQQPLDTPPARDKEIWTALDPQGYFPFVTVGARYAVSGAQFQPTSLHTSSNPQSAPRSWDQIAADLADPNSAAAQQILGAANILTAEICTLTQNKPANVCTSAGVVAAR